MMRLFVGSFAHVEFYDEIRRDMQSFFDAKWVEPKNLHLTWLFLGEHKSAAPIIDRLQPLKMIPRTPLSLQGFGTFGSETPRIFYLKTSQVITSILHDKIAGMAGTHRHDMFHPHVTMARIKKVHSLNYEKIDKPWMSQPLGSIESAIYLIESRMTPTGPVYIPLEEF